MDHEQSTGRRQEIDGDQRVKDHSKSYRQRADLSLFCYQPGYVDPSLSNRATYRSL